MSRPLGLSTSPLQGKTLPEPQDSQGQPWAEGCNPFGIAEEPRNFKNQPNGAAEETAPDFALSRLRLGFVLDVGLAFVEAGEEEEEDAGDDHKEHKKEKVAGGIPLCFDAGC